MQRVSHRRYYSDLIYERTPPTDIQPREMGEVECAVCGNTAKRTSPVQVTCGRLGCQLERNRRMAKKAREKARRRRRGDAGVVDGARKEMGQGVEMLREGVAVDDEPEAAGAGDVDANVSPMRREP